MYMQTQLLLQISKQPSIATEKNIQDREQPIIWIYQCMWDMYKNVLTRVQY